MSEEKYTEPMISEEGMRRLRDSGPDAEKWRAAYTEEHARRLGLQEELGAANAELAELRKDKARLDWLVSLVLVLRGKLAQNRNEARQLIDECMTPPPPHA